MTKAIEFEPRPDDDELVTKGHLRDALTDRLGNFKHEVKTEIKMELKGDFDELKMMISSIAEDQKNLREQNQREHEEMRLEMRGIRSDISDICNRWDQKFEKWDQKFEVVLKYMEGNEEDKKRTNKRLGVLESKVLLA